MSEAKKIFGLVGFPVKHSLSPLMHNAAFKALGIEAEYQLFEKREEELENFLRGVKKQGIFGFNVTVPYKEKVIPYLAKISDNAKLIGAVNTVNMSSGELEGFNTDGEGFLKHLKEDLNFNPQGKRIAIIGAGGAAKAVAVYLSKSKPQVIGLFDLDAKKLSLLIGHLKENFKAVEFIQASSIDGLNIKESDLLLNATPIGMKESDPLLIDEKLLHSKLLVYDVIYNPKETKLLNAARQRGCQVANGLGMLLYQGVLAFEIWTGKKAPVEVMWDELKKACLAAGREG